MSFVYVKVFYYTQCVGFMLYNVLGHEGMGLFGLLSLIFREEVVLSLDSFIILEEKRREGTR